MKKGFTLIELLAVILILGIIALIAIPQVTNVIENASKGAAETSAEHYIGAVNNKIAINKLDTDSSNDIDGEIDIKNLQVDITGEKPTSGKILVENGIVKKADVTVNGYTVLCNSKGKCTAEKGEYVYYYQSHLSQFATSDLSTYEADRINEQQVYIKVSIINGELSSPQTCIFHDDEELCLKYGEDYEISKKKIFDYFKVDDTWTVTEERDQYSIGTEYDKYDDDEIFCFDGATIDKNEKFTMCSEPGFIMEADEDRVVDIYIDEIGCSVRQNGRYYCVIDGVSYPED